MSSTPVGDRVRRYWAVARIEFRGLIALKGAFGVTLLGSVLTVVISLFLWRAVFRTTDEAGGYSFAEMEAYMLVAFGSYVLMAGNFQVARRIVEGTVIVDLLRPLDYQATRFAEAVGGLLVEAAAFLLLACVVMVGFGVPAAPADLTSAGLFAVSYALALLTKFLLLYLAAMTCFWTTNFIGVDLARHTLTALLSGALVPIVFFPDWLRSLCEVLPFVGLVNVPADMYLGRLVGSERASALALQVLWAAGLWLFGRLLWGAATRRLVLHGG